MLLSLPPNSELVHGSGSLPPQAKGENALTSQTQARALEEDEGFLGKGMVLRYKVAGSASLSPP